MSTSWSGFDFSHPALASRILASPGRMSYLSKSKLMSLSSGMATNSLSDGRPAVGGVCGAAVAGALGCICDGSTPRVVGVLVAGAIAAVPVGAGADACVVAGRLAQPARAAVPISNDTTKVREGRVSMSLLLWSYALMPLRRRHRITAV